MTELTTNKEDSTITIIAGSCHCKNLNFTIRVMKGSELTAWDCNCSLCNMKKNVHIIVPGQMFHASEAASVPATLYQFNTQKAKHLFCPVCGVEAYYVPRSNTDGYAVTVACLDPESVKAAKVRITVKQYDGINWEQAYESTGIQGMTKSPHVCS
ncbi:hypothetical protein CEUSTIGMA_g7897.t1 [Chlamydomonas eustigma]|uniref:CENP-V/GFA domain-containing protein n=1 Tax=Chlamydomonas eustigma TaxID=1157962 RepID=A0A250XBK5_9CHLO|nr:hypothetical protein CEUSTIGMA_g7897.t1 [Chlamydomonas eustigma]|eukprot:GAX80458.1 hypothetical protein CEUSTIGMA_g7897.t1 [Chlamydomonas eustigma]